MSEPSLILLSRSSPAVLVKLAPSGMPLMVTLESDSALSSSALVNEIDNAIAVSSLPLTLAILSPV